MVRALRIVTLVSITLLVSAAKPEPPAPALDKDTLAALKARAIGPAIMGGRVSSIALDPSDGATFYVGLGTGGIMKTTNAGASFSAIFEKEKVAAIGDIAVAPSDPKVVWVGSGEGNDRNSSSWGDGVYRSEDSGATWTNVGLGFSKAIPRVVVAAKDPKTAWVAVMGDLWNPGGERGLYKTTDAGKSWKRLLSAPSPQDAVAGCGDFAVDPQNQDVIYAALYARRRTPWSFAYGAAVTDGKNVSGIFKTIDGGAHWTKLTKGLPDDTGRIGLAVFAKNPRIVYAVVQSDEEGSSTWGVRSKSGGVFRSDDAGSTWTRVNPLNPRPFYFSQIRVDPESDQRVYLLGYLVHVSDDGGKSFREDAFKKVHPDCHALVIDPAKRDRLLLGTDGGVYQTYDVGKTWDLLNKFAAGEYYRINVDDSVPYRICGGLQDNSNFVGPVRTYSKDGIMNSDWIQIGGGDGFSCAFDSKNPTLVYAESQGGEMHRFDFATGEIKVVKPEPAEGTPGYRFHWNSPLIGSVHEPGVLYLAGNRVFRFTNKGENWKAISPDLTAKIADRIETVGSGAETYGIVYTLAESPVKKGMLWAGTDDGKLWVTEDDGGTWSELTSSLPAAAKGEWISRVEPGHDAATAYLVVDAHRSGKLTPMIWRTGDRGKSWASVSGDLPDGGPAKVVREDPTRPDVLYAGTEFGLFATLDRGAHWVPFGGLPTVAVDDILVHPREKDLVIATHGRSLFVVDDVSALGALTKEARSEDAKLFPIRAVLGRYPYPGWVDSSGGTVYRGDNPPDGALLTFWVKATGPDPVKIEIKNASDQTVANLTAPAIAGLGRVAWDLKPTKDVLTEYGGEGSLFVRPGTYTAILTLGKATSKQSFDVKIAPGIETR
ncbi:MAG TPA: hypothetical protein VFV19_04845 [Candidatus Polarisedimenticolaceae bacterium]|nr:hypothetical protein [Candidatus Polarisedimenticolaceae bacterium]